MINLNLLLAVFWLIVGGLLFLLPRLVRDADLGNVLGTGLSAGWLALVLAFYNLARWWAVRRSVSSIPRLTDRGTSSRAPPAPGERDPNFIFDTPHPDPPPQGGRERN